MSRRATNKIFKCALCSKTFNRAEHARRHEDQHNGMKAYACGTCRKSFSRKDALLRHQAVHDGNPSLLETKSRACQACARSKTKCSGSEPCTRCLKKDIACSFPGLGLPERRDEAGESVLPEQYSNSSPLSISLNTLNPAVDVSGLAPSTFMTQEQNSPVQRAIALGPAPASDRGHIATQDEMTATAMMPSHFEDVNSFDVGYWSPNNLSSINWLPIDMSPSSFSHQYMPSMTLEHTQLSQPSLSTADHGLEDQASEAFQSPETHLSGTGSHQGPEASQRSGDYYIDSDAARLTRTKRRKIIRQQDCSNFQHTYTFDLGLACLPLLQGPRIVIITDELHCAMAESFQAACIACVPYAVPFASTSFPCRDDFGILLDSYFYNLHQTLSCIHQPTFQDKIRGTSHDVQLLVIAIALLGSAFNDAPQTTQFATSMFEFGKRLLMRTNRHGGDTTSDTTLAQAQLLFLIGAKATLADKIAGWRESVMCDLRAFCLRSARQLQRDHISSDTIAEADWSRYIQKEEQLRTTYLVWQLDLLANAQGDDDDRPHLPLSVLSSLPLPGDGAWAASDAASWKLASEQQESRMTLFKALRCLYMEKRLPLGVGDFNHISLLYAVIHRTWDVQHDVSQPFANMEPSAERETDSGSIHATPWPPAVPHFARWRNSACDCFDILHWQANAAIGNAKGLEPPKVLHLHLARLLTLSPLARILALSYACNAANRTGNNDAREHQKDEDQRAVFRWATSDQYKARLAAIHAGVIFWHVRRYSTNAFHEPFAVLAAAITLWALSIFGRKRTTLSVDCEASSSAAVDDGYEIILIDRPTDDELVQQFVRSGHEMRVHMSVVNNLWDKDAPPKVLGEGRKLLSSLGVWVSETRSAIEAIDNLLKYKV